MNNNNKKKKKIMDSKLSQAAGQPTEAGIYELMTVLI